MASPMIKWAAWLGLTGACLGFFVCLIVRVLLSGADAALHTHTSGWDVLLAALVCAAGAAGFGAAAGFAFGSVDERFRVSAALVGICMAGVAADWLLLSGGGIWADWQLLRPVPVLGMVCLAVMLSGLAGTRSRLMTGFVALVCGLGVACLSVGRELSAGVAAFREARFDEFPLPKDLAIAQWVFGGLGIIMAALGTWQVWASWRRAEHA